MDIFFQDKKTPVMLSRQLRTMIQTIGQTKNKQQQDLIIRREISTVRQQIANGLEADQYPDVLVKLIYFETMGFNTSFAHILPINLCQSSSIYIKKMAYLLAAMLVRPDEGVGVLMHNTLLKDLNSDNLYVQMIALTMLRYFLTQEIVTEVLPILQKMRKHKINMIRRKAILLLMNIHQIHPRIVPDIKSLAVHAFNDGDAPVVFAGISVLSNAVREDPISCKDLAKQLSDIMFNIIDHKYPQEYDYHKIPAPWAQIEILKMFEALGRNDHQVTTLVVDAIERTLKRASTFQMHFNKAIVQQCIKTIANIYPHKYLLEEAENSLGRFFDGGNNNMKYFGIVALTELTKVRKDVIDKWQFILLECMDSTDLTLAEKTLGLLVQIANQSNTTIILDRLITLTEKSTDDAERMSLISKALLLIEKFSDDREIFLRRMNQIFYKFESLISDQTVTNFLKVLSEISEFDEDFPDMAVPTYIDILLHFRNPALVKVSAWVIAEFSFRIYEKDRNVQKVDESVSALLNAAEDYMDDRKLTFILSISLAKLATLTSKKDEIKAYWLKVGSSKDFFLSTTGQELIKMVKYSKAFCNSEELSFNKNMSFLSTWAEENAKPVKTKYLISKAHKNGKRSTYDIFDSQVNGVEQQTTNNLKKHDFKFNPGSRWGKPDAPLEREKPAIEIVPLADHQEKKKDFTLRGPHQEKKTKNIMDQKKLKLAKSIFGTKKI